MREGDVFLDANGKLSVCTQTERVEFPDGITVYNFTVDGNHDYFVIAQADEYGQTCILVHNACWDNLLDNSKLTLKGRRNTIYERPGGLPQAQKDFNDLNPGNIRALPDGTTLGTLPDGTNINIHPSTSQGSLPTLEIQTKPKFVKIRYTE